MKTQKAGDKIGNNAPATLVVLLDSKLKAKVGAGVTKVQLKGIDYLMENYRERYAQKILEYLQ